MKTVRTIVKEQMRKLEWGPYDLAKAVRGKMAPGTIYGFVGGKSELNTKNLMHVLDALGLEITEKPQRSSTKRD